MLIKTKTGDKEVSASSVKEVVGKDYGCVVYLHDGSVVESVLSAYDIMDLCSLDEGD